MRTIKIFGVIAALSVLTVVGASVFANPPAWEVPDGDGAFGAAGDAGPGATARQAAHLRMQLGRYYLLSGDYSAALEQYLDLATAEIPEEVLAEHPRVEERVAGPRARAWLMAAVASELLGDREQAIVFAETGQAVMPEPGEGRRHRRGTASGADMTDQAGPDSDRPERARRGQRCPDDMSVEDCRGRLRQGRRDRHGRGGPDLTRAFERFLEDPAAFAERFGGGAAALEARLLALEAELSENAR